MASALVRKWLLLGTVGAFISGVSILIMPICLNVALCLEARPELTEELPYPSILDELRMPYIPLTVIGVFVILLTLGFCLLGAGIVEGGALFRTAHLISLARRKPDVPLNVLMEEVPLLSCGELAGLILVLFSGVIAIICVSAGLSATICEFALPLDTNLNSLLLIIVPIFLLVSAYFFGSLRGWIGGVGGLLSALSGITTSLVPPSYCLIRVGLYYLIGVGMVLMGVALHLQSKAVLTPPSQSRPKRDLFAVS